jgi:mycothiol synthase
VADGYELRPPRRADADAVVDALNEHSLALHGVAEMSRDEMLTWFDAPNLDLERDARIAVLEDGCVVGYADVSDDNLEHRRYWLDVRMRPGYYGSQLLASLERRIAETAGPEAIVRGFFSEADEGARRLYDDAGFRLVRHSLRMRSDLDGDIPEPVWPQGIGVRTFEPEGERSVYEAHMESFADHWEFTKMPFDEWRHWLFRPPFDPSVWFLACDGDEIAGICLCRPEETGEPDMGWVSVLGVRPRWRRRGLALALLRHAFAEFDRRGKATVGLGVDAENTTGAVRLYERAGMRIVRRYDIVEKPVRVGA